MAPSTNKRPKDKPLQRCAACKKTMKAVTPGHLRTHGLTPYRYERMYGMRSTPSSKTRLSRNDPQLLASVGDRLLDDKVWMATISDEVGERMLNGPLKQRLSLLLSTMLFQRAQVHAESVVILSGALQELKEDWRILQGGPGGGPTSTEELLRIIQTAGKLSTDAENSVARAIKLALDEQRANAEYADGIGPSLYSGQAEKLGLPADLTSGDREAMRILTNRIAGLLSKRREPVDVEGRVLPPSPGTPTPQGGPPGTSPGNDNAKRTMHSPLFNSGKDAPKNDAQPNGPTVKDGGTTPPDPILSSPSTRQRNDGRGGQNVGGAPPRTKSVRGFSTDGDPPQENDVSEASGPGNNDAAAKKDATARKRASNKRKVDQKRKAAGAKRKKGVAGRPAKKEGKVTKKPRKKRGKR